jgi:hypothetical protein
LDLQSQTENQRLRLVETVVPGRDVIKAFVKRLLHRAGWDVRRQFAVPTAQDLRRDYESNGRVPWSTGYKETKNHLVRTTIQDDDLLEVFRRGRALPPHYGIGIDERAVEFPWVFANLTHGPGRLLDAGGVLNRAFLVEHPVIRSKQLHILTLVPEGQCQCRRGVSHLYADLRDIPVRSGFYDAVACVSTLEHVGMDNTKFRGPVEAASEDYLTAVADLRRVLRPGGLFLLTVPYGPYRNFGTFQLFDRRLVDNVIAAFSPTSLETTYFRYAASGWDLSDAEACATAEYVPWIMQGARDRPTRFPPQPDGAAAARAVACLKMTK